MLLSDRNHPINISCLLVHPLRPLRLLLAPALAPVALVEVAHPQAPTPYRPHVSKRRQAVSSTCPRAPSLKFSGYNWSLWSGVFTALLQLNEVDAILFHATLPSGVDPDDWASVQKKAKAYLRLYCAADVHSTVELVIRLLSPWPMKS